MKLKQTVKITKLEDNHLLNHLHVILRIYNSMAAQLNTHLPMNFKPFPVSIHNSSLHRVCPSLTITVPSHLLHCIMSSCSDHMEDMSGDAVAAATTSAYVCGNSDDEAR